MPLAFYVVWACIGGIATAASLSILLTRVAEYATLQEPYYLHRAAAQAPWVICYALLTAAPIIAIIRLSFS